MEVQDVTIRFKGLNSKLQWTIIRSLAATEGLSFIGKDWNIEPDTTRIHFKSTIKDHNVSGAIFGKAI